MKINKHQRRTSPKKNTTSCLNLDKKQTSKILQEMKNDSSENQTQVSDVTLS